MTIFSVNKTNDEEHMLPFLHQSQGLVRGGSFHENWREWFPWREGDWETDTQTHGEAWGQALL